MKLPKINWKRAATIVWEWAQIIWKAKHPTDKPPPSAAAVLCAVAFATLAPLCQAQAPADTVCTRVTTIVTTTQRGRSVVDSSSLQRCSVGTVPTPPPPSVPPDTTPAPPPTPPPATLPAWAQAVDRLLGPIPNCAQLATASGPLREWYDAWRKWEPARWKADSARWDAADYYDRASIYYAMAVCELPHDTVLSATYRARGDALARNYRDVYVIPNAGGVSAHWSQLEGVAVHALTAGDSLSRRWVGRTAERLAVSNYYLKGVVGDTTHIDYENRIGQRMLLATLLAHALQVPGASIPATKWATIADSLVTLNLRAQRPNGSWGFRCLGGGACQVTFPYMDALWDDALVRMLRLRGPDARVLPSVRATVDFHRARAVRADSSWTYNLTPSTYGGATASPDLNGLHPYTWAWLSDQTGDSSYRAAVAPLFLKGVRAGYYSGSKQFNQAFYNSYRYVALEQRGATP